MAAGMTIHRVRGVVPLAILGFVAVALAHGPVSFAARLSSLIVVVCIPALAASRFAASLDLAEQLALGYGGLALSCWSLWLAGVTVGLTQNSSLMAPLLASLALAAMAARGGSVGGPAPPETSAPSRVLPAQWGTVLVASLVLVGLVFIPFLPYGQTLSDGVHRMGMTDWYKHLMVTTDLRSATRLPPANPFLTTDASAPYYYGFHLIAASIQRGANDATSPYVVLLGLTLATAAALPIVLFVLARGLFGDAVLAGVAAVGGSLLAGFDLIVWLLSAIRETVAHWPLGRGFGAVRAIVPSSHLNFWLHHNERQLNPPYLATIWAPHHVSAVLMVLLVIHVARRLEERRPPAAAYGLPAVMLAALPAMSAYVGLAFVVAIGAVVVVETWRQRSLPWRTEAFRRWSLIGVPAALLSVPVVAALTGSDGGQLTVAVSSAGSWTNGALWSSVFGDGTLTRLLDTPALYFVQYGMVGVYGLRSIVRRARRQILTDSQREAVTMAAAIVVLVTFVRPPVGTPNNLYARPTLVVWALLACFAAADWREPGRRLMRDASLIICVAGTGLAVAGAAAEGALFWPTSIATVRAAQWINDHAPASAIVASPPSRPNLGYWLWRRTVTSDRRLALLFGASGAEYDDTARRLQAAGEAATMGDAWRDFGALSADIVLVDGPVPAWGRPPCFHAGYERDDLTVLVRDHDCNP
jgi:hypothetical protein